MEALPPRRRADELPIWGYVGELETKSVNFEREFDNTTRYYLFTHLDFSIAFNQNHIIEVNVSADPLQRVDLGTARRRRHQRHRRRHCPSAPRALPTNDARIVPAMRRPKSCVLSSHSSHASRLRAADRR